MSDANTPAEETADDGADESNDQPAVPNAGGANNSGPGVEERPADETNATVSDTGSKLVSLVEYATFGILCLLALVATFRFYFAASEAIRVWFSSDFVPVFQAAFNLVILVAAALGISVLVRRIA